MGSTLAVRCQHQSYATDHARHCAVLKSSPAYFSRIRLERSLSPDSYSIGVEGIHHPKTTVERLFGAGDKTAYLRRKLSASIQTLHHFRSMQVPKLSSDVFLQGMQTVASQPDIPLPHFLSQPFEVICLPIKAYILLFL